MCDYHKDGKEIPVSGIGYKIFERDFYGNLISLVWHDLYYRDKKDNLIRWTYNRWEKHNPMIGFCFFLDKEVAIIALEKWKKFASGATLEVNEIQYFDGIYEYEETGFVPGIAVPVAICKAFDIKEGKVYV